MNEAQQAAIEQQENPLFVCLVCNEPVVSYGGKYFYTCEHQGGQVVTTPYGLKVLVKGAE